MSREGMPACTEDNMDTMERWQSGRMYYLGKVACEKSHRGFESPSLRYGIKTRCTAAARFNSVEKEVDEKGAADAGSPEPAASRGREHLRVATSK